MLFRSLGERFMQIRWHRPDSPEAGEWAIGQQGAEETIREEMWRAIRNIFDPLIRQKSGRVPCLKDQQRTRVASMAEVVALGRTHVFRNGYGNREIEYVPEAEANTRISKGLAASLTMPADVKLFSSTLQRALREERHFALVDGFAFSNQGSLVINSGQNVDPTHASLRSQLRS